MPYAENQGIRIHYEIEGEGPPLVLQHGFTSRLESWRTNGYADTLRREYQLVLIDARGHGASDKPHDPVAYAPTLRAGDVVAVLNDLGVKSACFWGYSMGGRIGFALAKYAPETLLALIVGGMHAFERRLPAASLLDGTDAEAFAAALITRWGGKPGLVAPKRRKELLANDFLALAAAQRDEPSLEDVLPTIKVPCLLYAGDRDAYYEGAEESSRAIPGGSFVALRGLNHHTAFQNAALILPFVLPFLRSVCR